MPTPIEEQVALITRIEGLARRLRERVEATYRLFRDGEFSVCEGTLVATKALGHELGENLLAYDNLVNEMAVVAMKAREAEKHGHPR